MSSRRPTACSALGQTDPGPPLRGVRPLGVPAGIQTGWETAWAPAPKAKAPAGLSCCGHDPKPRPLVPRGLFPTDFCLFLVEMHFIQKSESHRCPRLLPTPGPQGWTVAHGCWRSRLGPHGVSTRVMFTYDGCLDCLVLPELRRSARSLWRKEHAKPPSVSWAQCWLPSHTLGIIHIFSFSPGA